MTKKDFEAVAAAIASVEAVDEVDARTLRLVVDQLSGAFASVNPRFNAGIFEVAALPLRSQRRKEAVLAALAEKDGLHRDKPLAIVRRHQDNRTKTLIIQRSHNGEHWATLTERNSDSGYTLRPDGTALYERYTDGERTHSAQYGTWSLK